MKIAAEQKIEWMYILRLASQILNSYRELESRVEDVGYRGKLDSLFMIGGLSNLIFSAVKKLKSAGLSDSDMKDLRDLISTIDNIDKATNVMKNINKLLEDKTDEFSAIVAASSAKDCETLLDETLVVGNTIGAFEERKEHQKQIQKN